MRATCQRRKKLARLFAAENVKTARGLSRFGVYDFPLISVLREGKSAGRECSGHEQRRMNLPLKRMRANKIPSGMQRMRLGTGVFTRVPVGIRLRL
jgi:hypothetical protein